MTKQEVLEKLRFDMEVRNRSTSTVSDYCTRVRIYQDYYDKPADQMGETEIRKFLHYLLVEKKMNPSSVNTYNASIRYVYTVTLNITLNCRKLPRAKVNRRLPDLPSKEELLRIFNSAPSLKYKAMFMTMYGSGLRISEAANLKILISTVKICEYLSAAEKETRTDLHCYPKRRFLYYGITTGNTGQ